MWRFILLTFAFLGWSFYILSGGSTYQPVANSIQAQAGDFMIRPVSRPGSAGVRRLAASDAATSETSSAVKSQVAQTLSGSAEKLGAAVTLASARTEDIVLLTAMAATQPTKAAILTAPRDADETAESAIDLRRVTGDVVNMRSGPGTRFGKVAKLTRGTEVSILRDPGKGWLKLKVIKTGRIGWMAGRLISAPIN